MNCAVHRSLWTVAVGVLLHQEAHQIYQSELSELSHVMHIGHNADGVASDQCPPVP